MSDIFFMDYKALFGFIRRFTFLHLISYGLFASIFLIIQKSMLPAQKEALEFYEVYRSVNFPVLGTELLRGVITALILSPFYRIIVSNKYSFPILFGALWGLAILGSLAPFPGSIEGMIYTQASVREHLMILLVSALQMLLLCGFLLEWEKLLGTADTYREENPVTFKPKEITGYAMRFTVLYVVIYGLVGILFFFIQDYEAMLETGERFSQFRATDHPLVAFAIPIQIFRGALLALLIYPFYNMIMNAAKGWLLLFLLFFGLTVVSSPVFLPSVLSEPAESLIAGTPEAVVQILLFSWLMFKWEKRVRKS